MDCKLWNSICASDEQEFLNCFTKTSFFNDPPLSWTGEKYKYILLYFSFEVIALIIQWFCETHLKLELNSAVACLVLPSHYLCKALPFWNLSSPLYSCVYKPQTDRRACISPRPTKQAKQIDGKMQAFTGHPLVAWGWVILIVSNSCL